MAVSDYLPSRKTVLAVVLGGAFGAGATYMLKPGPESFEPSKETCSRYFETRQGRFICIITGKKEDLKGQVAVPEEPEEPDFGDGIEE